MRYFAVVWESSENNGTGVRYGIAVTSAVVSFPNTEDIRRSLDALYPGEYVMLENVFEITKERYDWFADEKSDGKIKDIKEHVKLLDVLKSEAV